MKACFKGARRSVCSRLGPLPSQELPSGTVTYKSTAVASSAVSEVIIKVQLKDKLAVNVSRAASHGHEERNSASATFDLHSARSHAHTCITSLFMLHT